MQRSLANARTVPCPAASAFRFEFLAIGAALAVDPHCESQLASRPARVSTSLIGRVAREVGQTSLTGPGGGRIPPPPPLSRDKCLSRGRRSKRASIQCTGCPRACPSARARRALLRRVGQHP